MMGQVTEIDWKDLSQAVPAFLTLIIIPFSFSITNGILFGLCASLIFYVTTGDMYTDLVAYYTPLPVYASSGLADEGHCLLLPVSPSGRTATNGTVAPAGHANEGYASTGHTKPVKSGHTEHPHHHLPSGWVHDGIGDEEGQDFQD